jgi:RNA polymerase sigma-70 factor, ECF subfamily
VRDRIEELYRTESRRVLATLIRLLGDFDLAEEAMHDAFLAAVERWPADGVPDRPVPWLVSTGRFAAIDRLRRRARFDASLGQVADTLYQAPSVAPIEPDDEVGDDRLRLIFTCCHPALPRDGQVALTLREVCGLTTEAIAAAFLTRTPAIAQRIVRAKGKIRDARIPYEIPPPSELADRMDAVLQVIYLVFNEGYTASAGASHTRPDLTVEAIRLGRLLADPQPTAESLGLLALMLLHDSRRATRTTDSGDVVLLEDQDRSRWDQAQIAEGLAIIDRALRLGNAGPYAMQGAIAALHAQAPSSSATDWGEIVVLYDLLMHRAPSPVVALNRAVAIAMRDGPAAGLALVEALLAEGQMDAYRLAHTTRGELLRRSGRRAEALEAFRRAHGLAAQESERRFIERRMAELAPTEGQDQA